jgi:hypothetical protein
MLGKPLSLNHVANLYDGLVSDCALDFRRSVHRTASDFCDDVADL